MSVPPSSLFLSDTGVDWGGSVAWGEGVGAWLTLALGVHILLSPITVVAFASHLALFLQRSLSLSLRSHIQLRPQPFRLERLFLRAAAGPAGAMQRRGRILSLSLGHKTENVCWFGKKNKNKKNKRIVKKCRRTAAQLCVVLDIITNYLWSLSLFR